ncbi:hypothetical protein SODALDRAFT_293822 [Sodiomyces alkalinus F11]|uniref:LIM zinc-binding domain-containing protein n=1 Tax=Sodiomyces alkalinus (strain CBS 110278 / VKM F-3762 / F11) TaxID=1314773 RepID=A0A3N2PZZ2_SODAK|nr:hypothetical protein SODALDRAFT_293822 [Sodiomyces alkalinus F11]ROT40090.1 hypothetical protein SODALDRAFT_293822 [Sodiomyces alkalinus F11]
MRDRKSSPMVTSKDPSLLAACTTPEKIADLRNERLVRPSGARPLPTPPCPPQSADSAKVHHWGVDASPSRRSMNVHSAGSHTSLDAHPTSCIDTPCTAKGPSGRNYRLSISQIPTKPSRNLPNSINTDRGLGWMEKTKTESLGIAMEDMHLGDTEYNETHRDEEGLIYKAALDEASELVWQHQHGRPRQLDAPYRYKPDVEGRSADQSPTSYMAKDSQNRSSSSTRSTSTVPRTSLKSRQVARNGLSGVNAQANQSPGSEVRGINFTRSPCSQTRTSSPGIRGEICQKKRQNGGMNDYLQSTRENSNSSSAEAYNHQPLSKDDREPFVDKLANSRISTFSSADKFESSSGHHKRASRRSSTQSHNPHYVINSPDLHPHPSSFATKTGLEIRSQDLRDATSMRLRDRSSRLPCPSAVSDHPGRPIVSFDVHWKAPDETTDHHPVAATINEARWTGRQKLPIPATSPAVVMAGAVTARFGAVDPPSIVVQDTRGETHLNSTPSLIVCPADDIHAHSNSSSLPQPLSASPPGKRHTGRSHSHWSPAPSTGKDLATTCHQCGLCMQGRFVSVAGMPQRFHPHCFVCFTCGTSLEALEVSPEPDSHRTQRLDRIRRRAQGESLNEVPGQSRDEDGDERLRFYCHLDWHELFAPRCKHCKTPILGEHIVALGAHWHYGHFFCAECGDPFERGMAHIEKDGYAWCVNCQTKRTERQASKCKKCGLAVVGQYIRALGAEWHEACLRCAVCNGTFDDGTMFTREEQGHMMVLCTGCRTRELKA